MATRQGRQGRQGKQGRKGSSSRRPKNPAGKITDLMGIELDIYEGINEQFDFTDNPGQYGGQITPGGETGPVSPMDCEKWPGSPFCGGWDEAFEGNLWPEFEVDSIGISNCEIIFNIKWSALGWKQPTISIGWRKDSEECKPEPKPDDDPENNPIPEPPPDEPEISLPTNADSRCMFALGISYGEGYYRKIIYVYKPIAFYEKSYYVEAAGKTVIEPILLCHGLITPQVSSNAEALRLPDGSFPSFDHLATYRSVGEGSNQPIFPDFYSINDLSGNKIEGYAGGNGLHPSGPRGLTEVRLGVPFTINTLVKHGLWNIGGEGVKPNSQMHWGGMFGSPGVKPIWIRSVGFDGKWYDSYISEARSASFDYEYNRNLLQQKVSTQYFDSIWDIAPTRPTTEGVCLIGHKPPFPGPEELEQGEMIMKGDCCKAVLRKLRKVEAVLQPDKFLKFDKEGKPGEIVGKIPKRLTTPGGAGYEKLAGYSDTAGALVKMLDRISGFWPTTVEIKDIDPNTPGDQEFSMQIHSISDGFKQALEALAQIIIKSNSTPQQQDDEDDPTLKILAAILTEVGLTHKISAITQQTANNIEEFLDYKVRQQEEFLPMAFNPIVERTWQELEYTKPTKAQMDQYIDKLLTPSIQDVIVTKVEDNKLFTEWMLELLKHSSAASAALTQQIKSKEDLKKAMGTARFNALVQGALNMEQIRRVLGLPSNWDMADFSERLEDNFHPDENVESGLHAETKPKQAKEKPRIKDISKNGRRRKR